MYGADMASGLLGRKELEALIVFMPLYQERSEVFACYGYSSGGVPTGLFEACPPIAAILLGYACFITDSNNFA